MFDDLIEHRPNSTQKSVQPGAVGLALKFGHFWQYYYNPKQTKFLYWAILGCQSDQIAAASWSGNSDNQLSLNLSPNIRILFDHAKFYAKHPSEKFLQILIFLVKTLKTLKT